MTPQEIRVYLFLAARNTDAHIEVFRGIEPARDTWLNWRLEANTAGLLHVGRDRPSLEVVRPLFISHPGRMMVSEAARWLLSPGSQVCPTAVAMIPSSPFQHEQKVYVIRSGWGYEVQDESPTPNTPSEPADIKEIDYLEFRDAFGLGDPFEIARICPAHLRQAALSDVPMTVRCRNVMQSIGLSTIEHLGKYYLKDALKWANFGKKSAADLAGSLDRFIAERLKVSAQLTAPKAVPGIHASKGTAPTCAEESLISALASALEHLKDNARQVFDSRVLAGLTLEQTGAEMGITRERVRQIEVRLLQSLANQSWVKETARRLLQRLHGRSEPLFLDLLEVEDPWFEGWSERTGDLSRLMLWLSTELRILTVDNRLVASRISADELEKVRASVVAYLRSNIESELEQNDVHLLVESFARSAGAPELSSWLYESLQEELHYRHEGQTLLLSGVGSTLNETLRTILEESDIPLHYTEVCERVSTKAGRAVSAHSVHARLLRLDVVFFGRGRYGTERHLGVSNGVLNEVLVTAESIVAGERWRQWHVTELCERIDAALPELPDSVDKYTINAILGRSRELVSMGRFVWAHKEGTDAADRGRIDLADACEQVLRASYGPLSTEQIRSRIKTMRGTSEFFLLQPSKRIGRTAPHVWGLVERDFGVSPPELEAYFGLLQGELQRRQKGLHMSELESLLATGPPAVDRLDSYKALSLAQTDARFRLHKGHIVALSEWGEPRRLNIRSAFSAYSKDCDELDRDGLVHGLSALTERPISWPEISTILQQTGWKYVSEGHYILPASEEDQLELELAIELAGVQP